MLPEDDTVDLPAQDTGIIPEADFSDLPPPARQRAVAQVRPISMIQVVLDMAGRDPVQGLRNLDMACMSARDIHPTQFPAWCQHVQTAGQKRKAQDMSRSECEVFAFLTTNTSSQQQAKHLLDIITNVCILQLL